MGPPVYSCLSRWNARPPAAQATTTDLVEVSVYGAEEGDGVLSGGGHGHGGHARAGPRQSRLPPHRVT